MALSIQELLSNPEIKLAMEEQYSPEEIQGLVSKEMTPAALKKQLTQGLSEAPEETVLVVLMRIVYLLLVESLEDDAIELMDKALDSVKESCPQAFETFDSVTLLENAELKNLVKAIAKQDVFLTRKKKTEEPEAEEVLEDCPLDTVKI